MKNRSRKASFTPIRVFDIIEDIVEQIVKDTILILKEKK